jgi:TolB-like protein
MIGAELGASAVLTVRVVKINSDDFSINAELINTQDRRLLWGEQYNRRGSDLHTIQTEISREIIEKLKPRLTNEKQ